MRQVSWLLISVCAPQCHVRRLALDEAEQVDKQRDLTHVVDNVPKLVPLDDLLFSDGFDRVVGH